MAKNQHISEKSALQDNMQLAFEKGNYHLVRKMALAEIRNTHVTGDVQKRAASLLMKTGIDPLVIGIGVATLVFISIVALWATH